MDVFYISANVIFVGDRTICQDEIILNIENPVVVLKKEKALSPECGRDTEE